MHEAILGRRSTRHGLTIVELLAVIAIVILLLALLLPALAAVKQNGRQTIEMSAARQLMIGYLGYASSHGAVMTGYRDGLTAWDEAGAPVEPAPASRYPWRLMPYLDFAMRGLYTNENRELLETLEAGDPVRYRDAASLFPSLGLNTTWFGGDQDDHAFDADFIALFGKYFLTRVGQARMPERLIVFASAWGRDPDGVTLRQGYHRIRPPCFFTPYWVIELDPFDAPEDSGNVALRYGGQAVCAFLDAHTDLLPESRMRDMRHWANQADTPDWCLEPRGLP